MNQRFLSLLAAAAAVATTPAQADPASVAGSINTFGLDLHRRLAAGGGNLVTSPWSIESALAMTYAGASGKTKKQMATVLHFPDDEAAMHEGFAGLAADLKALADRSQARIKEGRKSGGPATPLQINVANRLFGQDGYPFEKPFLTLTASTYDAPLQLMDFKTSPERERGKINAWVGEQTKDRIKELIPPGVIDSDTRLVLANAVYVKAAWAEEFRVESKAPFFVDGSRKIDLPGLVNEADYGYAPIPGGVAVTVPYADGGLHFVLLIPDARDGLAALEKNLTPSTLAAAATATARPILLHFPSFKLEPGRVMLADHLTAMGMPAAFDSPAGSADFSRLAPRKPDDYLFISEVIHQAFIAVDQHGTEAAAATAVVMPRATALPVEKPKPLEIRVDRPFAFALQHAATGACLFLGRVTDPR